MFTQCPECLRQFRIRADQLSVAAGEVKCGFCGRQFNALVNLRDRPLPPTAATEADPAPAAEPAVEAPGEDAENSAEPQFSLPQEAPAGAPEPRADATDAQEIRDSDDDSGDSEPDAAIPPAKITAPPHYEFPGDYLEEEETRPGRRSRILWGLGAVLLMLLLILQTGWFYRDRVVRQYPQLAPYLVRLCERLPCRVTRFNQIEDIRLVNRDVREHPRYQDSLLVNATMINDSGKPQPFPRIMLRLFDTSGKVMSWRQFQPDEYLDGSIDQQAGMAVNVPVHFVLEVTGPTAGAVSFEFDFLGG